MIVFFLPDQVKKLITWPLCDRAKGWQSHRIPLGIMFLPNHAILSRDGHSISIYPVCHFCRILYKMVFCHRMLDLEPLVCCDIQSVCCIFANKADITLECVVSSQFSVKPSLVKTTHKGYKWKLAAAVKFKIALTVNLLNKMLFLHKILSYWAYENGPGNNFQPCRPYNVETAALLLNRPALSRLSVWQD